jgi:hypothetical protein
MMEHIKTEVEKLVAAESEKGIKEYGLFHSTHEGYAVIKEEIEECKEELEFAKYILMVCGAI